MPDGPVRIARCTDRIRAFGPSRILVLGPDSALVALIVVAVTPLAHRGGTHAVMLAGALALLSGIPCALVGLIKLGFVANLLSTPIRHGNLNGLMSAIAISQSSNCSDFRDRRPCARCVLSRSTSMQPTTRPLRAGSAALAVAARSLAIILVCRRWAPRVPGVLSPVVAATVATALLYGYVYAVTDSAGVPRCAA